LSRRDVVVATVHSKNRLAEGMEPTNGSKGVRSA
jgi:hypothetical protein